MTPDEWRKAYEQVGLECSRLAMDLDRLFDLQPTAGHGIADCIGLREDLRDVAKAISRRFYAMTPDE